MAPASVALDIQALQQGSGADAGRRRRIADLAAAVCRAGRLAAALIAPELPAPAPTELPAELTGADPTGANPTGRDLLRWDTRTTARDLLRRHALLVHYVPAPLLHSGPGDRGGMIVSSHWGDAGIPRLVQLEPEDVVRLQPSRPPRLQARLEWIRASDRVVVDPDQIRAVEALGITPSRCIPATAQGGDQLAGLDEDDHARAVPLTYRLALFGPFPPGGGGIGAYNARFVEAVAASGGARIDAVTVSGMGWEPPAGVDLIHAESFGTDVRPASYDWVIYTLGNSDGHLPTVEAALRHPGWVWLHEARLPAVATTAFASLDDGQFRQHMDRLLERAYPQRPPLPAARAAGRSHLALAVAGVGLTAPLAERAAGIMVNSVAARRALDLDLPPLAWRPPIAVVPPACPPPPARAAHDEEPSSHRPNDLAVAIGVVSMGKRPDLLVDAAALAGCRLAFVGPCPEILAMVIRDRATARGIADRVEVTGRLDDADYWEWLQRATLAVQLRDSASGEMSAAVLDALAAGLPVLTNLPSAADYPDGTVELLAGAAASAGADAGAGPKASADAGPPAASLAQAMGRLLGEEAAPRRAELAAAGLRFAQTHQMEHLADAVMTLLQSPPN